MLCNHLKRILPAGLFLPILTFRCAVTKKQGTRHSPAETSIILENKFAYRTSSLGEPEVIKRHAVQHHWNDIQQEPAVPLPSPFSYF